VLTKLISYLRGHKMNLIMCCPNPSHASEVTKYTSTCVDPNLCSPNHSYASEDTKCISTILDQTHSMPARKQHVNQLVLSKISHAREDRRLISKCVDQSHSMSARTKNLSQLVLTKALPCQSGHEMRPNMC
jgi:hypothetical protein